MPETGIGLFPDVGGGWFLPRLAGETGTWLALTGARLKASDNRHAGIATHYVESADIEALKVRLRDACAADEPAAEIESVLSATQAEVAPSSLSETRPAIDRLFAFDRVEDIVSALKDDGSAWATAQAAEIAKKSPQSLKVALRQIRTGRTCASFSENMKMEYRIACRVVMSSDFREGVRATIIDKDNAPRWQPGRLEEVADARIDSIFSPLPPDEELNLDGILEA